MRGSLIPETPRQRNSKERLERGAIIIALVDSKDRTLHSQAAMNRLLTWELLDLELASIDLEMEQEREIKGNE